MVIIIKDNNQPRLIGHDSDGFYFDTESLRVRSNFGTTNRSECNCSDDEYADTLENARAMSARAAQMTETFRAAVKAKLSIGKYDEITERHIKELMYNSLGNAWTVAL